MAELYLGRWEWDTSRDPHWRAPGGNAVGALDLRTLPQCGTPGPTLEGWGLFAYAAPTVHANLVRSLGSDLKRLLTAGEKLAIRSAFGRTGGTRVEDRLGSLVAALTSKPDDPAGITFSLMGKAGWQTTLKLIAAIGVLFGLPAIGSYVGRGAAAQQEPAAQQPVAETTTDK